MKAKPTTVQCPECGGPMVRETRPAKIEYKGHHVMVDTDALWCTECGESIVEGAALMAQDRAYRTLKAKVDGVLTPEEVISIREKLGLTQRAAGDILGGGPRAFQKYEKGDVAVSAPMSNLLRLLANDPKRLRELLEIAPKAKAHSPVAVAAFRKQRSAPTSKAPKSKQGRAHSSA
jgi:HTH-type transcriptional regulator/antitoxin MqsA